MTARNSALTCKDAHQSVLLPHVPSCSVLRASAPQSASKVRPPSKLLVAALLVARHRCAPHPATKGISPALHSRLCTFGNPRIGMRASTAPTRARHPLTETPQELPRALGLLDALLPQQQERPGRLDHPRRGHGRRPATRNRRFVTTSADDNSRPASVPTSRLTWSRTATSASSTRHRRTAPRTHPRPHQAPPSATKCHQVPPSATKCRTITRPHPASLPGPLASDLRGRLPRLTHRACGAEERAERNQPA
jgi:hypothetical protein